MNEGGLYIADCNLLVEFSANYVGVLKCRIEVMRF